MNAIDKIISYWIFNRPKHITSVVIEKHTIFRIQQFYVKILRGM